ncbi:MAG: M42 family metallopeptidase [Provencibacterium sp.]|nr:M42 family metallopeptidase [Provencibacterium sp.]
MIEWLKELSAIPGVSGDEGRVRSWLEKQADGYASCHTDALGNLLVEKKGAARPKRKLLFCTQMDEAGLVIRDADEEGNLRFECAGALHASILAGKTVRIGENGIAGVVGVKPIHLLEGEERERYPKLENLVIDIGAQNREQACSQVKPGDRAVLEGGFMPFGDGLFRGRALDARAGCALFLSLIRDTLPYDCTFAFTVLGESGGIGAQTAAYACAPEITLLAGVAAAGDFPGVSGKERACALGEGPVVPLQEKRVLYPSALTGEAIETARALDIPLQLKESHLSSALPGAVQSAGIGSGILSVLVPCRYAHTPLPLLDGKDLASAVRLLLALLERLAKG